MDKTLNLIGTPGDIAAALCDIEDDLLRETDGLVIVTGLGSDDILDTLKRFYFGVNVDGNDGAITRISGLISSGPNGSSRLRLFVSDELDAKVEPIWDRIVDDLTGMGWVDETPAPTPTRSRPGPKILGCNVWLDYMINDIGYTPGHAPDADELYQTWLGLYEFERGNVGDWDNYRKAIRDAKKRRDLPTY